VDSDGEGSAGRPSAGLGTSLSGSNEADESKARRAAVDGVVMETLPSALYKVRLDQGSLVMAHIADRMDRNFVRILVGDKVRIELSPQDVGRGRIVQKL
jgi:translation initiation factor IF-1